MPLRAPRLGLRLQLADLAHLVLSRTHTQGSAHASASPPLFYFIFPHRASPHASPRSIQHATCSMHRASCIMHHASRPPALPRTTTTPSIGRSKERQRPRSMQHATCSMPNAACNEVAPEADELAVRREYRGRGLSRASPRGRPACRMLHVACCMLPIAEAAKHATCDM